MSSNTQRQQNRIFKMLVLSDMHYFKSDKFAGFDILFNNLLEKISEVCKEDDSWCPDCIILGGDIIDCKESEVKGNIDESYESMSQRINDLVESLSCEKSSIYKKKPVVVTVPGNHDKDLSEGESVGHGFNAYAKFASKFNTDYPREIDKGKSSGYILTEWKPIMHADWLPKRKSLQRIKHNSIQGIMKFTNEEVAVWAFNSEWNFSTIKGDYVEFDEYSVKRAIDELQGLKNNGYKIITVTHRSPYKARWEDIFRANEKFGGKSIVDAMIEVSDLIICGHDHRPKKRNPDILSATTPLHQNGYVFGVKDYNDKKSDFSASLLRFNFDAKILTTCDFVCDNSDKKSVWTLEKNVKKFFIKNLVATPKDEYKNGGAELTNFITMTSSNNDDESIKHDLRNRILGERADNDYVHTFFLKIRADDVNKMVDCLLGNIKSYKSSANGKLSYAHVIVYALMDNRSDKADLLGLAEGVCVKIKEAFLTHHELASVGVDCCKVLVES